MPSERLAMRDVVRLKSAGAAIREIARRVAVRLSATSALGRHFRHARMSAWRVLVIARTGTLGP